MKIGLLGTGNLAVTLGRAWAGAGHSIVVTGRNPGHATAAAEQIGAAAAAVGPRDLANLADVVAVAVSWDGLESALMLVGGPEGALTGKTVVDCTNPVDYATGRERQDDAGRGTGDAADPCAAARGPLRGSLRPCRPWRIHRGA